MIKQTQEISVNYIMSPNDYNLIKFLVVKVFSYSIQCKLVMKIWPNKGFEPIKKMRLSSSPNPTDKWVQAQVQQANEPKLKSNEQMSLNPSPPKTHEIFL